MTDRGFCFADDESLLVALSAGWIPAAVAAEPVVAGRTDAGLVVAPPRSLSSAEKQRLRKAGVAETPLPSRTVTASCWAELLPARVARKAGTDATTVVFELPVERVAAVAAEILRLGCPRQELRMLADRALLRVIDPPYYAVARALDRVDDVRVFRATSGGRVLVELGYDHPLAERIAPRADAVVMIRGEGPWTLLADGPFEDLGAHVQLGLARAPVRLEVQAQVPRIAVPLRLARAARPTAPTAFALPISAEARLFAFVRSVPEDVLDGLLFAATVDPPRLLLRARPGFVPGAAPLADAEAFAPHPQAPSVMVPSACTLEPPVRREHLVALLAPEPGELSFVRAAPDGVVVERVPEAAFQPLSGLVDWIVDRSAGVLEAWKAGVTFDFDVTLTDDPEPRRPALQPPRERAVDEAPLLVDGPRAAKKKGARKPKKEETLAPLPIGRPAEPGAVAAELAACEAEFFAFTGPADAEERNVLYRRMGGLLQALERRRDAGLCYAHAIFEADDARALALGLEWAGGPGDIALARALADEAPSADAVRTVVSYLAAGATSDVATLSRWLDQHDQALDVRSLWLGWLGVSRLSGGDRLALARARDTILGRLSRGLSLERDVPSFLRFVGDRRGGRNSERLAEQIEGLFERMPRAPRTRSPVEAKAELTRAYVGYVVAYGLARLGAIERARALVAASSSSLDQRDPVHGFLTRAFRLRIDQAVEGLPTDTALPPGLAAELDGLERFLRYKVDRLRQASSILEPTERLDPIAAFQRAERDPRGDRFAGLSSLADRGELHQRLRTVMDEAETLGLDQRARLFHGVVDFLPELGELRALPLLRRVLGRLEGLPTLARAQLLEESLGVAGHFGDANLVQSALGALVPLLRAVTAEHAGAVADVVFGALRALRRVGLRDEAATLLRTVAEVATGDDVGAIVARVHVAGGLCYLGREDEAQPHLDLALLRLAHAGAPVHDRLALARALSRAVGHAREETALAALHRLEVELTRVTDSYNTNSHFCLSVVAFVEAIVLGYASDELALGELGRRFLDEDEHLVRRRLLRDMAR